MNATKFFSIRTFMLAAFGVMALMLTVITDVKAAGEVPPVILTEVTDIPADGFPISIVYNFERGDVAGRLTSNGKTEENIPELGALRGVTIDGTFVPAGNPPVALRIRFFHVNVHSWDDAYGHHTKVEFCFICID